MLRFLALLALGVALLADAPQGSIEDVIDDEMPASGVPGLAYAVVADGEIAATGGHGVVRIGGDRPVTPDTPFLTGSVSKSFTALAVMQLVEAGDVDLDAAISQYLDKFSGRPARAITVRQLLSHTSGLSTLQGNTAHTDDTGGTDELAHRADGLADVGPAYQPDERWEYSNANYVILGRLIEVVSGQEYEAYVAANILDPIGMEDSFVSDGELHDAMATGHRPWFGTKRPVPNNATHRGTAPQGGIVASANDLARYLQTMMNGEDDVLSADGKARMMRPAGDASPRYGLGWYVDPAEGIVWHEGTTPGFGSLATMLPDENNAAVVLVNSGSGLGFGETIDLRNGITANALDLGYEDGGSRWSQKALFIGVMLLPIIYVLSMLWAWLRRATLRAKLQEGAFGLFSLWFPLLTTLVAAWAIFSLVPIVGGAPLATIRLFQPDFGSALVASAVTGVLWALFRLGVAYTPMTALPGRRPSAAGRRAGTAPRR